MLLDREAFWLPVVELHVPPHGTGKATLRYEHQSGRTTGAAFKILGMGFGNSESITISRTVELGAETSGKSFEWKMLATATRYVDSGGGPDLTRVDITAPEGGPEYRVADLAPIPEGPSSSDDGWRVVNRIDLSSATDTGHSTWGYKINRKGSWTASVGIAPLQAAGIDLLKLECHQSEQFDVIFELPYGHDYVFYRRRGEWPITPRCALGPLPTP